MKTDDLIASLTEDLRPVRRVRSPVLATTAWFAAAAVAVCLAVFYFGPREDFAQRFGSGVDLPQLLAAVATGTLAAFAAFQRALPDRDWRWALLPVPAIAVWFATLAWGCVRDVIASGPEALHLTISFLCIAFISGLGLPLTIGMLWLSRHAAPLRPGPVAAERACCGRAGKRWPELHSLSQCRGDDPGVARVGRRAGDGGGSDARAAHDAWPDDVPLSARPA